MRPKKKKYTTTHCILAQLTVEEGLAIVSDTERLRRPLYVLGERVQRDHQRFAVLAQHPLRCCFSGLEATHWLVERHRNDLVSAFQLNVYAGKMMLTWDHILPRSLGGSNHPHNGRVACKDINESRGNILTIPELLWIDRQDPRLMYKQGAYDKNATIISRLTAAREPLPNVTLVTENLNQV